MRVSLRSQQLLAIETLSSPRLHQQNTLESQVTLVDCCLTLLLHANIAPKGMYAAFLCVYTVHEYL